LTAEPYTEAGGKLKMARAELERGAARHGAGRRNSASRQIGRPNPAPGGGARQPDEQPTVALKAMQVLLRVRRLQ
jgi:hypothetical protein